MTKTIQDITDELISLIQNDANLTQIVNVFNFYNPIVQDVDDENVIKGYPAICVMFKSLETKEDTQMSVIREFRFEINLLYKLDQAEPTSGMSDFNDILQKLLDLLDGDFVTNNITFAGYPTVSENQVVPMGDGTMISQPILIRVRQRFERL